MSGELTMQDDVWIRQTLAGDREAYGQTDRQIPKFPF